ncbi:WAP four-disulfide core domain protein 2 [Elysia marginata]|uniref:WAP four-disulfide core domain protein 2 n=1 Tax=Elysia marginata TaxID=1093978 RepID=A0AAV4I622_9GAST|nr:WAP four-disulfide core domain protein 2 [Elysia marginata]
MVVSKKQVKPQCVVQCKQNIKMKQISLPYTATVISGRSLSNSCSPPCEGGLVCVSERSVCEFHNCPFVFSCLRESQLPSGLLAALEQQRNAPPITTAPPREGCPRLPLQATCVNQCQSDVDCPSNHLCCSNGCVYRAPRRGACPRILAGSEESCETGCDNDYDCPGLQKCCQSSCGNTCVTPCYHWLSSSSHPQWQLSQRCSSRRPYNARNVSKRVKNRRRHSHSRSGAGRGSTRSMRDISLRQLSLMDLLDLVQSV